MTATDVPTAQLRELADDHATLFPLDVRRYHRMIELGILPEGEPFELLDGCLVRKDRSATGEDPMTVGLGHAWVIGELGDLAPRLRRLGCHMRVQLPITLPLLNEPEPDGAVVLGSKNAYRERHPGPADVTCVIEVADSSLARDRTTKLRIYAAAGIPMYVIVNLIDRVIEVYSEPIGKGRNARYGRQETLSSRQTLSVPAARGRKLPIQVRRLLP